jgi:predicted amidohydrolase YtcJ
MKTSLLILAAAATIVCSCQSSKDKPESTLYYNGTIITMEDPIYADALLVQGDTIAAVGTLKDVKSKASGKINRIDLKGKVLMPSFIDPHSHLSGYATSLLEVSLEGATDFEDIANRITKYIKDNKIEKGKWVQAGSYDQTALKEKTHPGLAFLDSIAPDNPLMIKHKSGHSGLANSEALKQLGLTAQSKNPSGGVIGKENGKLTGLLEENAFIQNVTKIPMAKMEDYAWAFSKIQDKYASYGITTIQEGLMVQELGDIYNYIVTNGLLKLDVVSYVDIRRPDTLMKRFAPYIGHYKNHFKIGGYKIILDGSPQGRTAWMLEPYENAPDGYRGYPIYTDEQLQQKVNKALDDHFQLLAHCNGDAASKQMIAAYQNALPSHPDLAKTRPVMVHAQLFPENQMDAAKALGIIPSFFVAHVWYWGDIHIQNFGLERASKISAANTALKHGMLFTFHQDSPVIDANMIETIWCAVNRKTKAGVILGPNERISPLEALKAVTINAAYQYFEENEKGSLKPGKKADLVVLSDNPLKIDPMKKRDIQVLQTIKDAKVIYQRGK